MIHKINNIVEIEHQGHEFYFDVEYNYDYSAYGGSIEGVTSKVYGYDVNSSDVCKDGEPCKSLTRRFLLAVAWSKFRDEIVEIIGSRIDAYLEENEEEELENLRDYFLD